MEPVRDFFMRISLSWKQKYGILAGIVIILVCSLFFGAWFLTKHIRSTASDIYTEIAMQRLKQQRLQHMTAMEEQYNAVIEQKETLVFKTDKNKAVEIITSLEALGSATNTDVKIEVAEKPNFLIPVKKPVLKPKAVEKTESVSEAPAVVPPKKDPVKFSVAEPLKTQESVSFSVQILGSYQNVYGFLKKIENMRDFGLISSLKMVRFVEQKSSKNPFTGAEKISASDEVAQEKKNPEISAEVIITFFVQ